MKFYKDKYFYIFLLISIAFFGVLMHLEFATDSYVLYTESQTTYINHFFSIGRFVSAAWISVLKFFSLSHNYIYYISSMMAIIFIALAVYYLFNILKKKISNNIIAILVSTIVVINPFSIELFLFFEKGIMVFSILCAVLAFKYLDKFFESNSKKNLIISLLFLLLSCFSYQGSVGLFVVLGGLLIIQYSKNIKSFIINNIIVASIYGIPSIINYVISRFLFSNPRVNSSIILSESLIKIRDGIIGMVVSTYRLLPKYLLFILILIILFVLLILIFKNRQKKYLNILYTIYILLLIFLVIIFPQIIQSTDSIWLTPRSTYPYAAILGILILIPYYRNIKINSIVSKIFIIVSAVLLIFQYNSFSRVEKDRYILNYVDNYTASLVMDKLNEYEKNTNIYVDKIAFYNGSNVAATYNGLFTSQDINLKATYPSWSRVWFYNFVSNRKFTEVEEDEEVYNKYFASKNWNNFNIEQVVIVGDTMHIYLI